MMTRRWSEEEILEQATCVMAECGERATRCAVLQLVLDELIESVGPWKLAHFIATTKNQAAAAALEKYVEMHWPDCAHKVAELLEATAWQKGEEELEREFGGD
jgi:GAF domain-containing protein